MPVTRYCSLIGLAIGAVWAFTGVAGAAITAGLAGVGLLVGHVLAQGVDLSNFGARDD